MSNVKLIGFDMQLALDEIILNTYMNGNEKIILVTIALYHKGEIEGNPFISMSIDKVASVLGCSRSTANKTIKDMVSKGYIESIRRGQGNPNIYVFKEWRKWQ